MPIIRCQLSGCSTAAHGTCDKCGVRICEPHSKITKENPSVFLCPECMTVWRYAHLNAYRKYCEGKP